MASTNSALAIWNRLHQKPGGKWLFSRLVCWKAPYFASIRPLFLVLEPGRCRLRVKFRRAVKNHIGTVHAIAMCNMAELAAGTMIEVTLPSTHRWIPKGMAVEYLRPARGDVAAVAKVDLPADLGEPAAIPVAVEVLCGEERVFRATIDMWVSPRRTATGAALNG